MATMIDGESYGPSTDAAVVPIRVTSACISGPGGA